MRVIVRHRHKKHGKLQDPINIFIPKKSTQYSDVLRELWERELNSWDTEPDRENSWFEEDRAQVENAWYLTEFYITTVAEMEV